MMKIKFFTIKKKTLCVILLAVLCVAVVCGAYFPVKASTTPKALHTIVIDAGHGGADGGAVGKTTSVTESYLNLEYAKCLRTLCQSAGINVVLTRENMNGLYSPLASNKKRSEMERRKMIINSYGADAVVSLHMNSYPRPSARGAQVYYQSGSEIGKELASCVQTVLHEDIDCARSTAKDGDFFVLNCSNLPSILVECGFLSNESEERLLVDEEYMQKLCFSILAGILNFFKM